MNWFIVNYLEIFGAISGFVYLYFSVNQRIWLWPMGILNSSFYISVFFSKQLYADMSLNIYYLIVSIYGWIYWISRKDNRKHNSIKISVLTTTNWIVYLAETIVLTIILAYLLIRVPAQIGWEPSSVPWWDAFITGSSIIATWMLARKKLDQWLWWIVIDLISTGVFFYKELYATSILFIVNTIIAVVGYINWKKEYKLQ